MEDFLTTFGKYPIINIDEYNSDCSNYKHDVININIDTSKLATFDEFRLAYVNHILECCISQKKQGCDYAITNTSRKYSFGDTPDWWDDIKTDLPADYRIEVEIL